MRGVRERVPQRGRRRHGVDDVAKRAKPHDEDIHDPPTFADPREQIARRMILRIADDGDAAAVAAHGLALGHGLHGVVGPLAVDVRLQREQQRRRPSARERSRRNRRRAAAATSSARSLSGRIGRPGPFSPRTDASSLIATTSRSASARGSLQVADVADVQQIEAAVGEGDRAPGGAIGRAPRRSSSSRETTRPMLCRTLAAVRSRRR